MAHDPNVASVHSFDISTGVDGPGIRFVVFTAGCPLACAYCHNPDTQMMRNGTRMKVGLVVESGEPREVHHFCLLAGYGAGAINPYLAFETIHTMVRDGLFPGGIDYQAYLAPGVMAQAAMFVAIFFGLAVIWERDVGQLQRLLATPLPRTALVLGKAAGAATRAVVQAVLLLIVVAIAGIDLRWRVLGVLGALVLLALGTGVFACLSMTIASLVKQRERFMGIGQLVMMPLFFASSALYPLAIMPGWLKAIAHVNPLTYEVEGLRGFLLGGGHPGVDLLVCLAWLVVLAAAATRAYPKAIL